MFLQASELNLIAPMIKRLTERFTCAQCPIETTREGNRGLVCDLVSRANHTAYVVADSATFWRMLSSSPDGVLDTPLAAEENPAVLTLLIPREVGGG